MIDSLEGSASSEGIQAFASQIENRTNVNFVTIMDMEGIRLTHPDPEQVGKPFRGGDEGPALKGKEYVSISKGTLGPSLRAFTPIINAQGKQVGAAAVGISLENVTKAVNNGRKGMVIGTLIGILIGIMGAVGLARYIKKLCWGLNRLPLPDCLKSEVPCFSLCERGL